MATQSCVIGIKFSQGDFEPQAFAKNSCIGKLINIALLTFAGCFLLVPLEVLDNLTKIFKLPGLLLGGTNGVLWVQDFFTAIKKWLTKLNAYQLASLEQQRKVTALLFENLPFTMLVFAIKVGLLQCHELSDGKSSVTVNIALASTFLQVAITVLMTWVESKWL